MNARKVDRKVLGDLVAKLDPGPLRTYLLWKLMAITVDGNPVSDITIDGNQVQEVTIDGTTVWQKQSSPSVSMFDNPQYQWWAGASNANDGETATFPEVLEGVSDASVGSGSPTLNTNVSGYDAIYYDGNSYHNINENGLVSDPLTVAALIYLPGGYANVSEREIFLSWDGGDVVCNSSQKDSKGELGFNINGSNDPGWGGGVGTDKWQTIAWTVDGGNQVDYYVNGSGVGGDGNIGGMNGFGSGSQHIGGVTFRSDIKLTDVNIAEIVVCSGTESGSNISSYHTDRV